MTSIALKIQRRKYPRAAINEIGIVKAVHRQTTCPSIIALREAFLHEGHICLAYDIHGRSLDDEITERPLTVRQCLSVTRQLLQSLSHLHGAGFTHTDIKPDNILYDRRSGEAKLADLGNAVKVLDTGDFLCTREYTPPEVLLGAPLQPALDYWSLGCTVFEMLTGAMLFDPRSEAVLKYREFYFNDDDDESDAAHEPLHASVSLDQAEETAEQYAKGDLIAGKYLLEKHLGHGRFGTVWSARLLHPEIELDGTYDTLWKFCCEYESSKPPRPEDQVRARAWRKEKGADDLRDLALNHEHLILMDRLAGPLPVDLVKSGTFKNSLFRPDGRFAHPGPGVNETIADRIHRERPRLSSSEVSRFSRIVATLCHMDPSKRSEIEPDLLLDPAPARRPRRRLCTA